VVGITKWNGKPIKKPGWYSGIPLDRYHSAGICDDAAVSSSNLRTCWLRSPAHMFAQWAENPKAEPRKPTRPMVLGSAAHHLLLGEDHFNLRYIAQPETYRDRITAMEKPWNNNAGFCKAWNEKQREAGRTAVTVDELQSIVEMSESLALEPLVNDGLLRGAVECSGFVKDGETGLWLKIRPDVIPATTADYVDLKTTSDVTTPALQSSIRSFAYHQQGALVWEVCEQLGLPFETFVLMFVETAAPFCARAVPLPEDDLARGRLQNRAMLRKIRDCKQAGHWPGPGEGDLRALPLSNDERRRIDERLKYEGAS
jgi:PDDEXK-like domain of unknown function (DUF3799)